MTEYKIECDPDSGEILECECCRFAGPTSVYERTMTHSGYQDVRLCEVCSNTHLSNAVKYPDQVSDTMLYRSLGYIANMILAAVKEHK